jgi:co-chaperonin GroES (HSP10)|tara:strand:+ start:19 stop:435 length:417 start_codon:yes stop_codon:yes gene_type:complete
MKPKILIPETNIININEKPYKTKKEIGKVPEPTGFRIVLFPLLLESKTKAGLHLTDETITEAQIATNVCRVLKVGPDAYKDKERYPNGAWCKVTDWVLITKYAGARIRIEGGELRIVNDDEILAVIDHPKDILPASLF